MPHAPVHAVKSEPHDSPRFATTDLIAGARRGEAGALTTLYEQHAGILTAVAARILGSVPDAEDVVQDLFVALPEALGRYTEQGQLDAWLRRVVIRLALSRGRAHHRRREAPLDVVAPGIVSPSSHHRRSADIIVDRIALERAITALPAPLRLVFVLREIEGYAHAEIAVLLGISRNVSEVRLFRAVRRLRALLA